MKRFHWGVAILLGLASVLAVGPARAQTEPVRLGIVDDESSVYSVLGGKGSVLAAQMAIDEFGGKVLGRPIELHSADHQNQPALGLSIAMGWLQKDKYDAILGGGSSAVLLAVQNAMKATPHQTLMITGASSMDFAGKACTVNSMHFAPNNYMLVAPTAKAAIARGDKSWYVLSSDNAGGIIAIDTISKLVTGHGGSIAGTARFPLESTDFSSYLLQAQASKAQVLGLGTSGTPLVALLKQAGEFGITNSGPKLVLTAAYITDINAIGLQDAQGLLFSTFFYWDTNDSTREWSKRFFAKNGTMPTQMHAATYEAVYHYLRAVEQAKTTDAEKVVSAMKQLRISDKLVSDGYVRADGAVIRPVHFVQVKTPADSKYPWDYYKILRTIAGDEAHMSMQDQGCPLAATKQCRRRPKQMAMWCSGPRD